MRVGLTALLPVLHCPSRSVYITISYCWMQAMRVSVPVTLHLSCPPSCLFLYPTLRFLTARSLRHCPTGSPSSLGTMRSRAMSTLT